MLGLSGPRLVLNLVCKVCQQTIDFEGAAETQKIAALFGRKAYAVCPSCGQEAVDHHDRNYRQRVRRFLKRHGLEFDMFLRFYGASKEDITKCLKELRALGHSFRARRKPLRDSMNFIVPQGVNTQVDLTFTGSSTTETFRADDRARVVYMRYSAPGKKGEFVDRKKGDPVWRHD